MSDLWDTEMLSCLSSDPAEYDRWLRARGAFDVPYVDPYLLRLYRRRIAGVP